jgi:hypothetical protein
MFAWLLPRTLVPSRTYVIAALPAGEPKHKKPGTSSGESHVPKAAMNWHYTSGCCHEIWACRLTVLILEKGEFIPPDFNMPRKTRTMSMTPFVIACECQANFRRHAFTSSCPRYLRARSRSSGEACKNTAASTAFSKLLREAGISRDQQNECSCWGSNPGSSLCERDVIPLDHTSYIM